MALSEELFPGARITTQRIAANVRGMYAEPQAGTVIERNRMLGDGHVVTCKCGCGGYWRIRLDGFNAPNDEVSLHAHDLNLMDIVDQLASRAEDFKR